MANSFETIKAGKLSKFLKSFESFFYSLYFLEFFAFAVIFGVTNGITTLSEEKYPQFIKQKFRHFHQTINK